MRVCACRCIVVEDSLIGLQAAAGAAMRCVITHTPSTAAQNFSGALAVYPELGDGAGARVTAAELVALLQQPVPV
jgi:beta-phosphoglucomutase-like phosphatase (HAD superfamily)